MLSKSEGRFKNHLWRSIFLSNLDEMRKSRRGPSIDASCKILLYLAKMGFREDFLEIDKPETRNAYAAMFVNKSI